MDEEECILSSGDCVSCIGGPEEFNCRNKQNIGFASKECVSKFNILQLPLFTCLNFTKRTKKNRNKMYLFTFLTKSILNKLLYVMCYWYGMWGKTLFMDTFFTLNQCMHPSPVYRVQLF